MSEEDSVVKRTLVIVLSILVFLALVFYAAAQYVAAPTSEAVATAKSKSNIKRVSQVVTSNKHVAAKVVRSNKNVRAGKSAEELGAVCFGCHNSGVGGAPKIGDTATWKARAKEGMDKMVAVVKKGKGIMAPNGGTKLTEAELKTVISHMLKKSGVK